MEAAADAPPTAGSRLRWVILGLLFAATVLNYVDRQTLSILAPSVQHDLHISDIGYGRIVQPVDQGRRRGVEVGMRVALGQEAEEPGEELDAVERRRPLDQARGPLHRRLERVIAEVLVEARAPGGSDRIARLEERLDAARAAAADEAEMAAMARVISSTIRLVSPCRLVPMMMPSSLHCIADLYRAAG